MRLLLALPLLCLSCLPCRADAEEIEPLDAEFLEYLATFGSDDGEDWVLFANEDPAAAAVREQDVVKESGPKKTEAAADPADER